MTAHSAFAAAGAYYGAGVNFMLVFAFSACVFLPPWAGYAAALLGGLFLDFFGTHMFGLYGVLFVFMARAAYILARNMDFQNALTQFMAVFILSLLMDAAHRFFGIILLHALPGQMFSVLTGAFINGLLAPVVFFIFKKAFK